MDRCYAMEELGTVAALPPDDARRGHLETCPRCRALLAAYRDFMAAEAVPEGADPERADRQLSEMLERELAGGTPGADARVVRAPGGFRPPVPRIGERLGAWWRASALRPALAVAAVLIVAGVVYLSPAVRRAPETPVLRGGPADSLATPRSFALEPPRPTAEAVELSWVAVTGAEAYQVILYSADLAELKPLPPVPTTRMVLRRDDLPVGLARGTPVFWRVLAFQGGEEIARSEVGSFPVP